MTVTFHLHTKRSRKTGFAPVIVRVRTTIGKKRDRSSQVNGEVLNAGKDISLSTGRTIHPSQWDNVTKRMKKKSTGSPEFNYFLDTVEAEIKKRYDVLRAEKRLSLAAMTEAVKDILNPAEPETKEQQTFLMLLEKFLHAKTLEHTLNTRKKYGTLRSYIEQWESKHGKVMAESMNQMFFTDFRIFLQKTLGLQNNSAIKIHFLLKAVLNWAEQCGYSVDAYHRSLKPKYDPLETVSLTNEELMRLYEYPFTGYLERARDIFCLMCFCGQRWSDMSNFSYNDVHDGFWIRRVQKTGKIIHVPLSNFALSILSKYEPFGKLPIISSQKMNEYIKQCCRTIGLDSPVTTVHYRGKERIEKTLQKWECISTHSGRRTFCSLSLEFGMSYESIMAVTGHKNKEMLEQYIGKSTRVNAAKKELQGTWNKQSSLRVIKGGKGKAV